MNLLNLLNPMKWFEGVIMAKVYGKGARFAAGALAGVLSGPWFSKVAAPILNQIGISINFDTFEAGMIVLLTGVFGGALNFIKHRFFKSA